jgi:hypothetical protein
MALRGTVYWIAPWAILSVWDWGHYIWCPAVDNIVALLENIDSRPCIPHIRGKIYTNVYKMN